MPRFHLNVLNSFIALDKEGIELDDVEDAKMAAVRAIRALIAEEILLGRPIYRTHRIEITDPAGTVLHTVRFGDVIDVRP